MNLALRKSPRMSVDEFVEMIRPYPDEERWELLDGQAVRTMPETERHQRIVANVLGSLFDPARAQGCTVLPGLGLLDDESDDNAPIPDVVVRCGPMVSGGYATDPVLVAEILSPSTMNNDRGRKLDFYTGIASLETILIVYQDEVRIEARRRENGEWRREVHHLREDTLDLGRFGTAILADIYEGVPLA